MERWRQSEIEALESVDHMLGALDIPHTPMNHDWVEVTGTSLHIQADYDNRSDTVTLSIWDTDGNGDTRTIWGMTLPYESMDELLGHLHSALIPLMKRHGDEGDKNEPLSDDHRYDREFVRSVFDDLTERLKKEPGVRLPRPWPERMVKDEPTIMVRDHRFYYGDGDGTKILRFSWEKIDNTVTFMTKNKESDLLPDGYSVYTVDELRRIDSDVLWDRVLGMVIRSMGPVVAV